MADQSTKGGGTVPWQTIIALMAAFGGAAFFLSNLSSSRPDNPAPNWATSVSYQDTPARLWQDPFGLISSPGPNSNASSGTSILSFANDGRSHKTKEMIDEMNEHLGHTIVLPVLVPGQPYAELVERRLRTRVAVSEALARCGYLPEDGEHLGYFMTPWHWKPLNAKESNTLRNNLSPATKADKRDVPLVVPFEWYSAAIFRSTAGAQLPPQGALYDHILVLWISEDAITDYPLARLAVLRDLLTQKDFFGNRTGAPPQFHIIGPWASNTLRSMVIEAHSLWNPPDPDLLSDVMMYSSTATASEAFLLHPDSPSFDPQPYGKSVADVLKAQTGLSLFRITQTDDVLCKSLVDELNLRIHPDICQNEGLAATPDEGPPNIAVISEWDTVYGRALPLAFAAAARGVSEDEIRRTPDLETHFPNIRYFSYLRGIDGKTPLAANSLQTPPDNSANAQNQTKSTSSANKFEDYAEAPEGTNQTDYLRRLADRLADWDSILRTSKGQRLDAVGFFGTDVYDELLIARALRDKLPNVIFFTTSMDARLTLPSEWRAAHNLVIVSSFGERLDSYIQGNIPPFRDGYETASFTATLTALGALPAPQNPTYGGNQVCSVLGNPRRFEVGRQGFYDLTVRDDDELDQDNALLQQRYVNAPPDAATTPKIIQPPRTDYEAIYFLIDWSPVMRFLGLIGLLAVLIFAFGVRPDKIHPGRIFWQTYFWVFLALAVAAFIVILGSKADGDRGAPLALFDGLSPWPTEVFRVLAIGLCVGLISSAHQAMKENDRDLAELLSFDNAPPQKLVPPKSLPAIQTGHWLQEVIIPLWIHIGNWRVYWLGGKLIASPRPDKLPPNAQIFAQNLWWEYRRRSCFLPRFIRTLLLTWLFWHAIDAVAEIWCTPPSFIRGRVTAEWDWYIAIWGVRATIYFTLHVLDGAYVNRKFINYLVAAETHWPYGAFDHFPLLRDPLKLTEYLDIRLIALRTRVVGYVVYYPFGILLLLVAARNSWLYDWPWSAAQYFAYGIPLVLAALAPMLLYGAAENARRESLTKIRVRYVKCLTSGDPDAPGLSEVAKLVENENEGAFSLFFGHPILAAIFLPSGSVAIWVLLEYLAKVGGS